MPKLSILVPIFNVEKYLAQCLDSLLSQTLKDIEIICLNDGSTDLSLKILEEYSLKDTRIKIINKENSGYGDTMNVGLSHANGEYIGILESDDFAQKTMFEDLYNIAKKDDCDVVKSNYYKYFSKNNKDKKKDLMKKHKTNVLTNVSQDPTLLFFLPSIWSGIYKKDFLVKNNITFLKTSGASYQDTSFHHKVFLLANRIILTDNAYIHYRQDNENSSVNNLGKIYCIVEEYKEIHKLINKNEELNKFREYVLVAQFRGYFWNLNRLSQSLKEEFFNHFYSEFKNYKDNDLLGETFFKYAPKKAKLLIDSPKEFYKKYVISSENKIASLKINKDKISLSLFGKKII